MKERLNIIGYVIVSLGALFYFYEYLLRIAPAAIKLELIHEFAIDATLFGTLGGAYFFAYTPLQIVVGVIVDKFNLRVILTMAVICCTLGSFMFAATHNYQVAFISRFLQGFGSAFAFVCALKLAALWLPAERFAVFTGSCAAFGFLGAAIGEYSLTHAAAAFGWRISLQSFTVMGIILAAAIFIFLRFQPTHRHPHNTTKTKLTFSEAFKQLWKIAKQPYMWIAGVLSFLMFLPTSVFAALWGVSYLEKIHGLTLEQAAKASALIFVGWAIGAPIQGWLSSYLNTRIKLIFINVLVATGLSVAALYFTFIPYWLLCLLLLLFGMCSSAQVLTFVIARDLCSTQVTGMAIAFVNTLSMTGGFIFQPGVGRLLDWSGNWHVVNGIRVYSVLAYEKALAIIPISLAIAAIIAFCVKERTLHTKTDPSLLSTKVDI